MGLIQHPQFQFQIYGVNRRRRNCSSGEHQTRGRALAGSNKGTGWGANSTEGGTSVRSDWREGRAAWAPTMGPRHKATNHMTGARSAFSKIDLGIRGIVKFSNGFVIEIKGCGTILFVGKRGEHHKMTSVYFIPRLKANLVSLGQLNETVYHTSIERGLLKICDDRWWLLTQVRCTINHLYILESEIEQPVSLSAKTKEVSWRLHGK